MSNAKHDFKVGDGVSWNGHSDSYAGTVVRVSATRVCVVEDEAVLLNGFDSGEPDALVATPGGFCAHVEGRQRYEYKPGSGSRITFTLRKDGRMMRAESTYCFLTPGRSKHHDYNF